MESLGWMPGWELSVGRGRDMMTLTLQCLQGLLLLVLLVFLLVFWYLPHLTIFPGL